jgi:L-ectoine synthase
MIVRQLEDARKTGRRVTADHWESIRLVLKDDNIGFSFHITTMFGGTETTMRYRNHIECVYCFEGRGDLVSLTDGRQYPVTAGSLYVLDKHDHHMVRAQTDIKMVCVFTPALHGREVHGADGSYPLEAEVVVL